MAFPNKNLEDMHRPCNRINDEECMKIMHAERLPRVNNLVHFCKFSFICFFCSIFVIPVAFLKCYVRVCDFTRQIRPLSSTVWKYFRNIVKTRLVYNPISIALSNSIVWKCFPWDGNILEIKCAKRSRQNGKLLHWLKWVRKSMPRPVWLSSGPEIFAVSYCACMIIGL